MIYAVVHLMLRRADKEFFKASKRNPDMRMPQISGGKIKQKPKGVHAEYLQARQSLRKQPHKDPGDRPKND